MANLSGLALSVDVAARMTVLNPVTRRPLVDADKGEAWIDLLAFGSSAGRAHDRALTDKQIALRGRRMKAEEIDADLVEKLAKLTQGWRLLTLDGSPLDLPFSKDAAQELYADPAVGWLRDQVLEFVSDLGNYPRPASTS